MLWENIVDNFIKFAWFTKNNSKDNEIPIIIEEKQNEEKAKYETQDAVIKALCEKTKVEIPSGMVEMEVENMLKDFEQRLAYQGLNLEQYFKMMGKTEEEVKKEYEPQAIEGIKSRLALEAVIKAEKIEATDKEVEDKMKEMAKNYGKENDEEFLKNENVKNVKIDSSVEFANLTSAFIAGTGDGVNLFEPNATTLAKTGKYYIATSVGTYSGVVPYTAFNALESNIKNNEENYKTFYKGIEKGLDYVKNHTSKEIAEIIKSEFPDTDMDDLIKMVDNYKSYDSWLDTPKISEDIMINLENIMIDNKELDKYADFKELVYEFN